MDAATGWVRRPPRVGGGSGLQRLRGRDGRALQLHGPRHGRGHAPLHSRSL